MDCSMSGFPVLHCLPEFVQSRVHWVSDAIQPSHPLSSPSPPTFELSQHQGLFQWVSQVAKDNGYLVAHLIVLCKIPGSGSVFFFDPQWSGNILARFRQIKLYKKLSQSMKEVTDFTNESSLSMFTVYVYINIKNVYFSPSTVLALSYSKPQLLPVHPLANIPNLLALLFSLDSIHRHSRSALWEGTVDSSASCLSSLTHPPPVPFANSLCKRFRAESQIFMTFFL